MPAITIRAASYWRYEAPCFGKGARLDAAILALADGIAVQSADALAHVPGWQPDAFVVCSTIVSSMITEAAIASALVFRSRLRPVAPGLTPYVVSAYECASWGYVLRHCASLPKPGRVLLAIADLDVHQFDHWTEAEIWRNLWGHTGFGVTLLCIDLAAGANDALLLSPGSGANSMMDFAKAIKAAIAEHPASLLCQPFFPEKTQEMFAKLVGAAAPVQAAPLEGLHAAWGHCFGSDPWIALISRCRAGAVADAGTSMIVASLAFNGYSAVADVGVPHGCWVELQDRPALAAVAPDLEPAARQAVALHFPALHSPALHSI